MTPIRTRCNVCRIGTIEVRKTYRHGAALILLGRAFHWLFVANLIVAGLYLVNVIVGANTGDPVLAAPGLTTPGITSPVVIADPRPSFVERVENSCAALVGAAAPLLTILVLACLLWILSALLAGKRNALVCNHCSSALHAA